MTYDQYWNDDCMLVKYYREADKMRYERMNQQLWLQGMYVYNAICCAAPIFHPFAKKGTTAAPYPDKPYALSADSVRESKKEKEKSSFDKGMMFMQNFMFNHNARFKGGPGAEKSND